MQILRMRSRNSFLQREAKVENRINLFDKIDFTRSSNSNAISTPVAGLQKLKYICSMDETVVV